MDNDNGDVEIKERPAWDRSARHIHHFRPFSQFSQFSSISNRNHYDYFNTPSQPKTEVKVKPATIEAGTPEVGLDKLDAFFAGLSAPIDEFLATAAKTN